jgi:hypothetical protein
MLAFIVYGPAKAMFSITESYATDSRTDWKKRLVFKQKTKGEGRHRRVAGGAVVGQ